MVNYFQPPESLHPEGKPTDQQTSTNLYGAAYESIPSFAKGTNSAPIDQRPQDTNAGSAPASEQISPQPEVHSSIVDEALPIASSFVGGAGVFGGSHYAWNKWLSPQARLDRKHLELAKPGTVLDTRYGLSEDGATPEWADQLFSGNGGKFIRSRGVSGSSLSFTPRVQESTLHLTVNPEAQTADILMFNDQSFRHAQRVEVSMDGKLLRGEPSLLRFTTEQMTEGLKGCEAINLDPLVVKALDAMKIATKL